MTKESLYFWLSVLIAIFIRIIITYNRKEPLIFTIFKGCISFIVGIFSAVLFTDMFIELLNLNKKTSLLPSAAFIALTSETVIRFILNTLPKDFYKILKALK